MSVRPRLTAVLGLAGQGARTGWSARARIVALGVTASVGLLGVLGAGASGRPLGTAARRPPSSVVILIAGFFSSLPTTETYDPLARGSADVTKIEEEFDPRGIDTRYGASGCQARPDLTSTLRQRGAVIVPFSYRGVRFSGSALRPALTVRAYSKTAPSNDSPTGAAAVLGREVAAVHHLWPGTRILLVGHSEGGLVAETYFADRYQRSANPEIGGIFSLDSPINGVRKTKLADEVVLLSKRLGLPISRRLIDSFFQAWQNAVGRGPRVIRKDLAAGKVYVPVGTPGDHLYGLADAPAPGLRSQVPVTRSDRYSSLGLVDPATTPKLGPGPALIPTLTASHECVLDNAAVIRAIAKRLSTVR